MSTVTRCDHCGKKTDRSHNPGAGAGFHVYYVGAYYYPEFCPQCEADFLAFMGKNVKEG